MRSEVSHLFQLAPPSLLEKEASVGSELAKALSVPGKGEGLRQSQKLLAGESAAGRTVLDAVYDYILNPVAKKMQKSDSAFLRTFAPLGPDPFGSPLVAKNLAEWSAPIDKAYSNLMKSHGRSVVQNALAGSAVGGLAGAATHEDAAEGAGRGALAGLLVGTGAGAIRSGMDYSKALGLARKAGANDLSYASISELASRGIGGRKLKALERWLNEHATRRLQAPAWEVAAPGAAAGLGIAAVPNLVNAVAKNREDKEPEGLSLEDLKNLPRFAR